MQQEAVVSIRTVNKWFGELQVLKNIDLNVASGERVVICGPSGSGKSTLIRCICELESHQQGENKELQIFVCHFKVPAINQCQVLPRT